MLFLVHVGPFGWLWNRLQFFFWFQGLVWSCASIVIDVNACKIDFPSLTHKFLFFFDIAVLQFTEMIFFGVYLIFYLFKSQYAHLMWVRRSTISAAHAWDLSAESRLLLQVCPWVLVARHTGEYAFLLEQGVLKILAIERTVFEQAGTHSWHELILRVIKKRWIFFFVELLGLV